MSEQEKKRGPRGELGTSTPGQRLKAAKPAGIPLKRAARDIATRDDHPRKADAVAWLASKK